MKKFFAVFSAEKGEKDWCTIFWEYERRSIVLSRNEWIKTRELLKPAMLEMATLSYRRKNPTTSRKRKLYIRIRVLVSDI